MKKICLFIVTLLMLFPAITLASEVDYDITNYYINADILTNGDMKVSEVIVLDGTFNGYIRDINYKNEILDENNFSNNSIYNATNLEIISVEAKYADNINFDIINNNDFEPLIKMGANGGYLESNITNGKSYKMYYKANNQKVAFKITYLLKDVVVAHQDVAELYWTFIGNEYPDTIRDLQIKVNLPQINNSENFRVWAHGDLAGKINSYDDQYLIASVEKLDAYSSMDIRTTFDLSLINSNITKKTNEQALDQIIEVETKRAEIANQERQSMKIKYYIILFLVIIWFIALIIAWIYVYIKYDKEYKKEFVSKYNREFIDEYNVEVIDYLFYKKITPNAMSASIMNLIYKKNIKVEEIPNDKKKKDYTFYLLNENNITESEKYLVDILFKTIGTGDKFTTIELRKYASSSSTCEKFSSKYLSWKNEVIKEGEKQVFYENQTTPKIYGGIFLLVIFIIKILAIIWHVLDIIGYLAVFIGVIFMIYTTTFNKRTKKGNEHYAKWKAFKNFLNDFGTFNIKELPEIKLWERYMVYATLFGLADKVSKVMNVHIEEARNNGIYIDNTPFYDWYIFNNINISITNSVQANTTAITAARANSSSSSGSGFGGGFSSGGGFGGGGGGGHGF